MVIICTSKGELHEGGVAVAKECARQDQGTVGRTKGADLQTDLRGLQPMGLIRNILLANGPNSVNGMIHSIWHQRLVPQHSPGE